MIDTPLTHGAPCNARLAKYAHPSLSLKSSGLLEIEIKSYKNRTITLTQTGNETIESIFIQIAAYYKNMVKDDMLCSDEDEITHEFTTTIQNAGSKLKRFTKYLPHRKKKI